MNPIRIQVQLALLLPIMLVASLLSLANLSNQDLWQDEAQTACISRTVLAGGLPRGYDGKNYFSQELGVEYGKNYVWKWHTWLPFYITAASFKLLGASTFSARVPFALCGIATVLLVFFFGSSLFPKRNCGVFAAGLLSVCVPFLILSRQCRYYSMAAFFFTGALYAYDLLLKRKRGSGAFLVLSLTLLFHTQYIYFFTLAAAITLHATLFDRKIMKSLLLLLLVAAVVNLPWMMWLSGMRYADQYGSQTASLSRIFFYMGSYGRQCLDFILFPFVFTFPVLYILIHRIRSGKWPRPSTRTISSVVLLALSVGLNIAILSIASPLSFFRYLAPIVPATVIAVAYLLSLFVEAHWTVCILATVAVVVQWPLSPFLKEVTHPFTGPVEGIVSYLNAHGSPSDTVAITYEDMPLKFYTSMRIVGGLTGEDLSPALSARWVIFRKHTICEKDFAVRRYLIDHINNVRFRKIVVDAPDTPFENTEEPAEHLFSTVVGEDNVVIFERVQ
jgi:4-amino-4-deoxy-L-arabinose transferase-like glycosyltransferase